MSDAKPQPAPKTPTERYAWVSGSSQSSKSIIERSDSPASPTFSKTTTAHSKVQDSDPEAAPPSSSAGGEQQQQSAERSTIRPMPRRSSYNYMQDAEEFNKVRAAYEPAGNNGGSAVTDTNPMHGGSFKPKMHQRTKSWDYQDVKRQQHSGLMMTGLKEGKKDDSYGFSEK